MNLTEPWKCSKCSAVVFIPTASGIEGGVCTQQRRGCTGEIEKMEQRERVLVRAFMASRGIQEQPWLTLVFPRSEQAEKSADDGRPS